MKIVPPPRCDSQGWFKTVLEPAPLSWPWALPHLYAVNVAPDPGREIIGASATPEGTSKIKSGYVKNRSRFEVVGFWDGSYALMHMNQTFTYKEALRQANRTFELSIVRYLMQSGKVIKENKDVIITGSWPAHFPIRSRQDIGIFCAFLYEKALEGGGITEAKKFRDSLSSFASNPTDELLVYISMLELAKLRLSAFLSADVKSMLSGVHRKAQGWLS